MKGIHFNSCLKIGNSIWFISVEGYLMNYDCETCQSKIVIPDNLDELRFKQVIDNMIYLNNNLYFVEQDGSILYAYNLITNYCCHYTIPSTKYINWGCFSGIYLSGQIIYLFTRTAEYIYCFDTVCRKFITIKTEKEALVMNSFKIGSKVYLFGEKIISFDIDNHFYSEMYCFKEGDIRWMNQYKNTIYYLTKNQLGIWDENNNSHKTLYEERDLADQFFLFLVTENKVFLLPSEAKMVLIVDKKTGSTIYDIPPEDLYYIDKGWAKYYGYTEDTRYIWCANRVSNYQLCIDKEKELIKWIKITNPILKDEIPYLKLIDKKFFNENELSLEQFVLVDGKKLFYKHNSYGKEIWKSVKK